MKTGIFNAMTLIAAFCLLFASCEKQPQQSQEENTTVFTASIMNFKTTVTIEGKDGKVAWVKGDQITITDAAGNSAVYEAAEDGSTVEFTLVEGETAVGAGPYKAFYNAESPALNQTYFAESVPSITMSAESSTTSLSFSVTSGLLKLTLSGVLGGNIKNVMVKGDETELYTLACPTVVDATSSKDFWVALPAGTYKKIYLTNSEGKTCLVTYKDEAGLVIAANSIQPVELSEIAAEKFDGVWLGTMAASGYPLLWAEKNVGASTPQEAGYYFSWGNTKGGFLNGVKGSTDSSFNNDNYNNSVGITISADIDPESGNDAARVAMGGLWRLPTEDEAKDLVKLDIVYNENLYTVTGINGNTLIMYATGSVSSKMENAGIGFYWTNAYKTTTAAYAIQLNPGPRTDGKSQFRVYDGGRKNGFCIRAVKD